MIAATVEGVAGIIEIGLRLFCVLIAVCFAAGFGSIAGAPGAVIAGGATFLYGMNLAVGKTATIGAVVFILVIALSAWTSDMDEGRDFNEGLADGQEHCAGLSTAFSPIIYQEPYDLSSVVDAGLTPPLPRTDMGHDDFSQDYLIGANNGCRKALGTD
jgi:hypothetical protein